MTPLTDNQLELLSAWIDGEVSAAERAEVEILLKRDDAREYAESLRATAALVKNHAPVRAPVGLSGRVMSELETELKPKAFGPGSEPFTAIPLLSWRAPLYAAAAAILVALGIMFGPALTSPGKPSDVARGPLDNLPQTREQARPETVVEESPDSSDGRGVSSDPKFSNEKKPQGTRSDDLTESLKRTAEGKSWGEGDDAFRRNELEKTRGASGQGMQPGHDDKANGTKDEVNEDANKETRKLHEEPLQDEQEDAREGAEAGKTPAEKPADRPATEDDGGTGGGTGGPKAELGGGGDPRPRKGGKEEEQAEEKDPGTDKERVSRTKKFKEDDAVDGETAPQPAPPALAEPADAKKSNDSVSVEISDAANIAAQTDVLWVSSLYGDAELTDEQADVESITVEVDADKLPELMAALRRLAKDQGYGQVKGDASKDATTKTGVGISGYLPADSDEAAAGPTGNNAPAEPANPDRDQPAQEKVRVVIRLK